MKQRSVLKFCCSFKCPDSQPSQDATQNAFSITSLYSAFFPFNMDTLTLKTSDQAEIMNLARQSLSLHFCWCSFCCLRSKIWSRVGV